jgi:hypothetical protein
MKLSFVTSAVTSHARAIASATQRPSQPQQQDVLQTRVARTPVAAQPPSTTLNALQRTPRAQATLGAGKIFALAAGVIGSLVGPAQGYACYGHGSDANQYFTNTNQTFYGVVHGWVSDCYDQSYVCGQSCSSSNSGSGSTMSCTPIWCTEVEVDRTPRDYVTTAAAKVASCGFSLVSGVPNDPTVRIANALIERNLWVKVSVNALNITNSTDPSIVCLHNIA